MSERPDFGEIHDAFSDHAGRYGVDGWRLLIWVLAALLVIGCLCCIPMLVLA